MSVGFGRDTWCLDALSPGRYATGNVLLAQAIYRRLTTPRGTLRGSEEAAAYGFDVSSYVGAVGEDAVNTLPAQGVSEIQKDDRVLNATCIANATTDRGGNTQIDLEISVTPADGGADFTLTLSVTDYATRITGLTT